MEVGMKVWARGGPALWQEGTVVKKALAPKGFILTVQLDDGGTKDFVATGKGEEDVEDLKLRNVAGQATVIEGAGVKDLTTLTHLHEPAILASLNMRYQKDTIYTYTGPILLAVNPFKKLSLYSDEILQSYKEDGERRCFDPKYVDRMAPHVYALADKAYRNMTLPTTEYNMRSQSILVSGESGAGKTETCKIIMKYVAVLGNASGEGARLGEIENQVLQSNPILEAFGNARTVRNDNSSRFGKYIQILFSDLGKLFGASIRTFLLEKVRVVKQSALERNYHIFYALYAGATPDQRKHWDLKEPQAYKYTNQSGCYDRRDGVTDRAVFDELMAAFDTMGVTEMQYGGCFDVIAAILALGNVAFADIPGAADDAPHAAATPESKPFLATAARLLGTDAEAIVTALTSRQVTAGLNHQVTIYLEAEQANSARDALSKALYAAMFTWMVKRTNASMDRASNAEASSADADFAMDKPFIGLLDIFGFEIFKENFFEQFLINYANEMLQQQFNDFVFRQEQEEYGVEQIEWEFISFPDNKDCLALIEVKPNGIIPTLDEQCLIGQPTDERFARELYKKCEKNPRFALSNKMRADHAFQVHHYAGAVTYSTAGMIEKNRDALAQEGVDVLLNSINPFVVLMGEIEAGPARGGGGGGGSGGGGGGGGRTAALKRTGSLKRMGSRTLVRGGGGGAGGRQNRSTIGAKSLGTQFRDSLAALVKAIGQTHPHYVRCIKPNDALVAARFDHERIAEQLRNAGVLEVVRVARAGFPVRLGVSEFVQRYGLLAPGALEDAYRRSVRENERDQERFVCRELIVAVLKLANPGGEVSADFARACRDNGLQMGLTKVFFQQRAFNKIEQLRTASVTTAAVKIQARWRCYRDRRRYLIAQGALAPPVDTERLERERRAKMRKAVFRIEDAFLAHRAAKAQEAAFAAQLEAQRAAYETRLAALTADLAALRAECDALRARPARFLVVAAPLGGDARAEDVSAAVARALAAAGAGDAGAAKTIFFEG
ncbi:myosin-like protein [Tribonema minus]|uniref:Myosin-like protein n=1 Tax=Tribonema minus TaxID=303371 RepID=A0A835ZAR7_9STRA|nr:myosin-like protein [Tribonema minus]